MLKQRMTREDERARLLKKRSELSERLEAINKDYRQGLEADSEERAIQLANAEVLNAIAESASAELDNIEKRLAELG